MADNPEQDRLDEAGEKGVPWKKWGPYLSERQWGTVREDYSDTGDAWSYFPHDQARSRAYRWGEDGLAGISDDKQRLCFALALWNGVDPILKERAFGLTNSEGNHGEDPKECYFYLDSTPTHSYMKYLYKYPQRPFPYEDLVETNRARGREQPEYELLDTGVFEDDRYFDVFVEYAKASPEDILVRITAWNRGPDPATLHLLPTLWFRNTWSSGQNGVEKPTLRQQKGSQGISTVLASHAELGERYWHCEGGPELLFTENETNSERLFGTPNPTPYVKDGIHDAIVAGQTNAVNPDLTGTKVAANYILKVNPGQSAAVRLRLTDAKPDSSSIRNPWTDLDGIFAARLSEADRFYDLMTPDGLTEDENRVMRQALAGMLWTKQYYYFDLERWLDEHGASPLASRPKQIRNQDWFHMVNDDIISMPDKWEYPWYAAWDLAFHTVALTMVDPDFARDQLALMLRTLYLHPNGQIPAYEWNFSDVNPPVHAWATLFNHTYRTNLGASDQRDLEFLKKAFPKLLLNFTWWVNRKDLTGKNVFQGGFLGLDNIGVFDRSSPLPTGGHLEQADGTAWMAFYSQNMFELALELSKHDSSYEDMALKFLEHFLWIASAMDRIGDNQDEMWDEEDGFFYDLLRLPDGRAARLKVRSMVGLLSLCAATVIPQETADRFPRLLERGRQFILHHPEVVANIAPLTPGLHGRRLMAILNEDKLRRVLARMLDEKEFLSPYGIRSLSRYHLDHPFELDIHGEKHVVRYLPAESNTGMFGGNSNWRGPIWMPVNILILRALLQYYLYYGDDFKVECPTGSGNLMTLFEVTAEIGRRLGRIFLRDASGRRPVFGGAQKLQEDPHWRDHILFYEYFHGDNGAGIGANHQTGWTGLVARVLQILGYLKADEYLHGNLMAPGTGVYREE